MEIDKDEQESPLGPMFRLYFRVMVGCGFVGNLVLEMRVATKDEWRSHLSPIFRGGKH